MEFKPELFIGVLSLSVPLILMLKFLMLYQKQTCEIGHHGKSWHYMHSYFCKTKKKGLSPPFLCPSFVRSQLILVHFQSWFIEHLL